MPPITAPAINPAAIPGPNPPPRQRASAWLGAATALTPSTAAVAKQGRFSSPQDLLNSVLSRAVTKALLEWLQASTKEQGRTMNGRLSR
jgi:hypothetical protein